MWDPPPAPAAPPAQLQTLPDAVHRSAMFNLDAPNMIRVLYVDYAGLRRCKVIPAFRIQDNVRFARCVIGMINNCSIATGATLGTSQELLAVYPPDLSPDAKPPSPEPYCNVAFRPIQLPWHPNHHLLLCNLTEDSGEPSPLCPRGALRRAIAALDARGLNAKAGFELEFLLLRRGDDGAPCRDRPFGGSDMVYASHESVDAAATVLDDMVACLERVRVPVRLVHREAAPGQFELVLDHCDVLEAVDRLVLARETVRAVARRHGLVATFVPKLGESIGSGAHVHLSLDGHFGTEDEWRGQRLGVDAVGRAFMAGVLRGLPWLFPFVNGHPLAYRRVVPGYWAGAYQAWGVNDKELPIRLMDDRTNFEVKCGDGITNPYIQVAAILVAGAMGVSDEIALPEPCAGEDPAQIAADKRPDLLPTTLEQGLAALEEVRSHELLGEVFPHELLHNYLCVKRADADQCSSMDLAEYEKLTIGLH